MRDWETADEPVVKKTAAEHIAQKAGAENGEEDIAESVTAVEDTAAETVEQASVGAVPARRCNPHLAEKVVAVTVDQKSVVMNAGLQYP